MEPDKDITDSLEESMTEKLPEAPQSISISAYYKGFKTIFTIRKANNKSVAVTETTNLIDTLLKDENWKPSWAEETNKKNEPTISEKQETCQHPEEKLEVKIVQSGKNTGKKYARCSLCNAFIRWA